MQYKNPNLKESIRSQYLVVTIFARYSFDGASRWLQCTWIAQCLEARGSKFAVANEGIDRLAELVGAVLVAGRCA